MSSLNSIGQSVFELESGNKNVDGQINGQRNGWNYTNFKSNLAMMVIYLSSLNSIGQSVFELESGNENVDRLMDGQFSLVKTPTGLSTSTFLPASS